MKYEVILHHNAPTISDNHLATFSVAFYFNDNCLTIKFCKLMVNKNKHKFISWPAYKNQEEKWVRYVFCTRDLQAQIINSVLNEMGKQEDHSVLKDEPDNPWEELEARDQEFNNE